MRFSEQKFHFFDKYKNEKRNYFLLTVYFRLIDFYCNKHITTKKNDQKTERK